MKNIINICALLAIGFSAVAQEEGETAEMVSKNGINIKPEAGDYGLGFNAVPIFNYIGNTFNGNTGNSINNGSYFVNSDNMIYGKYFLESDKAIRARMRIRDSRSVFKNQVVEQGQSDPEVKVEDRWIRNDQLFGIGIGIEKRRGKGRVQGIYGGEVSLSTSKVSDEFDYGNEMEEPHIAPETTTNFFSGTSANSSERVVSQDFGRTTSIGVNGFVGIEYAFAPKMAISAEFTWGIAYSSTGNSETETEIYTDQVEIEVDENSGSNNVTLDTGNYGGAIALLFYF